MAWVDDFRKNLTLKKIIFIHLIFHVITLHNQCALNRPKLTDFIFCFFLIYEKVILSGSQNFRAFGLSCLMDSLYQDICGPNISISLCH